MESIDVHDLTAAYALDAMSTDEAREYEEHLATCERCRRELAELSNVAGSLAFGVESPRPPAGLRDRILVAARAERENVVPLRPRWTLAAKAITAAAAVLAIAFAAWAVSLSRSLDSERTARRNADTAIALLADRTARRVALNGANGTLVVNRTGDAALVVSRLDRAPAGKTYEAWVIEGGRPERAGTFLGGGETSVLRLDRRVPNGATVAITLEKSGGVDAPQGPMVASAKPV